MPLPQSLYINRLLIYLLPPSQEDVLSMNGLALLLNTDTDTNTNTPASVFQVFKTNLESRQNLKENFNKHRLISIYNPEIDQLTSRDKIKAEKNAFTAFLKDFSIQALNKKAELDGFSVSLSLQLSEEDVAMILNDLINAAQQKSVSQLYAQLSLEKQMRINQLDSTIESARKVELDRRLDRVAQLKEAIVITESLKIGKPISDGPSLNINNVNKGEFQSFPLYMLGSDLLLAEKKVLESRENDDPFILVLRTLQQSLQQLESVQINKDKFGVVKIDLAASYGEKIKPKKSLILAVAGVLGLMLGVFVALIRRAIKNRQAKAA